VTSASLHAALVLIAVAGAARAEPTRLVASVPTDERALTVTRGPAQTPGPRPWSATATAFLGVGVTGSADGGTQRARELNAGHRGMLIGGALDLTFSRLASAQAEGFVHAVSGSRVARQYGGMFHGGARARAEGLGASWEAGLGLGLGSLGLGENDSTSGTARVTDSEASGLYAVATLRVMPSDVFELFADYARSVAASGSRERLVGGGSVSREDLAAARFTRLRLGVGYHFPTAWTVGTAVVTRGLWGQVSGVTLDETMTQYLLFLSVKF